MANVMKQHDKPHSKMRFQMGLMSELGINQIKKNRRKLSKAHPSSGPRPVFSDLKSLGSVSFWNLKSRYYRPYFEKLYLIICRCDSVIGNINRDHLAVDEVDKILETGHQNDEPPNTCLSLRAFLSSSCTFSCWPVWKHIIRKPNAMLEGWSLADLYHRCGKSRSWCRSCPSCNQGWTPQSGKITIEEKVFKSISIKKQVVFLRGSMSRVHLAVRIGIPGFLMNL